VSLLDLGGKTGFVVGIANASCAVALIAVRRRERAAP
jgi:hypothetical protein